MSTQFMNVFNAPSNADTSTPPAPPAAAPASPTTSISAPKLSLEQEANIAFAPDPSQAIAYLKKQGFRVTALKDADGQPIINNLSDAYLIPKNAPNVYSNDYIEQNGTQVTPGLIGSIVTSAPIVGATLGAALGTATGNPGLGGAIGGAAGETFNKYMQNKLGYQESPIGIGTDIAGKGVMGGIAGLAPEAIDAATDAFGPAANWATNQAAKLAPSFSKILTGTSDVGASQIAGELGEGNILSEPLQEGIQNIANDIKNTYQTQLGDKGNQLIDDITDNLIKTPPDSIFKPSVINSIKAPASLTSDMSDTEANNLNMALRGFKDQISDLQNNVGQATPELNGGLPSLAAKALNNPIVRPTLPALANLGIQGGAQLLINKLNQNNPQVNTPVTPTALATALANPVTSPALANLAIQGGAQSLIDKLNEQ